MNDEVVAAKPELESSIYVGAIATAITYLLPYLPDFIITPYLVGALVATWHVIRKRGQLLPLGKGAKLGFLSTFFGGLASAVVFDIIWQFFDFQLWQKQNSDFMLTIFSTFANPATIDVMKMKFAEQASKPFGWPTIIFQILGGFVMSLIFGSLFGLLGAKVFRRAPAR